MSSSIYCFDPTISDDKSKVRGVGRYLHILKENFENDWIFTDTIKRISADSIFIQPFYNFLQKPTTLRRIAKKQIAVIHDLIPLKYPDHFPVGFKGNLNIFLSKLTLKNYDLVVTDSEASKKDIIQLLDLHENKVKVIYPCLPRMFLRHSGEQSQEPDGTWQSESRIVVDDDSGQAGMTKEILNQVQHDNETLPPKPYILTPNYCLYVGDGTWNKNLVNLAKAIKEINVTCVFVGQVFGHSGANEVSDRISKDPIGRFNNPRSLQDDRNNPWQQELREFIKEAKDDKRFIFAGFVPDTKLIQLYQNAHCNILVSRDEGFGFSYLEAASQSCPSVLSDISVLHEISNNQGAMFADPNDVSSIANTIGEFYFRNESKNTLGIAAKKRAEHFSSKKFKEGFLKALTFNI